MSKKGLKGHVRGNRLSLVIRAKIQACLFRLGCVVQRHCGKAVLFGFLVMTVFSVGLIRAKLETNAENLWIEVGGQLEEEIAYTKKALGEGYGATNEIMIQTPNLKGTNILSVGALKEHLDAVMKASQVTVDVFDQTWSLRDICYTLSFPTYNIRVVDDVIPQIMPCVFITPLDCFWEGAKPLELTSKEVKLGSLHLKWTNLSPKNMTAYLKKTFKKHLEGNQLPLLAAEMFDTLLDEAGISSGYTEKPCLDPYDPECPLTSPNYGSKKKPDVGVELTSGCQGFAKKLLDWPEELIVGGVNKNRSGTIRSAEALQTIILLMGEQQLHARWHGKAKVNHLEWTKDAATNVLEAWKREFTKAVNSEADERDETTVLAFSSTSFNDLLRDFSQTSYTHVAIGYVLMLIYACLTLKRWNHTIHSHAALGFAGVLLVTLAVASALGLCSFVGLAFNAASTQVLPFLALGLGVDDMFLLAHTYIALAERGDIQRTEQAGYCLGSMGVSVLITSFTNMFAFFMAAVIPIPALRSFSLQAAIVVIFNFFAVIGIFPAMIGIDISRKHDQRYDLFCCGQRTIPKRISLTPGTSVDTSFVVQPCRNSCSSLSSSSASAQGAAVIKPGNVQASASQTFHLPGVVTLQASALAELGNTPLTYKHSKRTPKRERQVADSSEFQLSATRNVCSGDAAGVSKSRGGASANVSCSNTGAHSLLQLHVAGASAAEQRSSRETQLRQEHNQTYSRGPRPQYERTQSDVCTCSVSSPDGKQKKHAWKSHAHDAVVNESGLNVSRSENNSRRTRSQNHVQGNLPKNVHIQVLANAASTGDAAQATAEYLSTTESARTITPRSFSGVEFAGGRSTCTTPQSPFSGCGSQSKWGFSKKRMGVLSLSYFAKELYGPWLQKMPVKISVLFVFAGLFAAGLYGCMEVEEGLDLSDVVPRKSQEHKFVEAQFKYFSFHQMFVVTKGDYDYPNGQKLLYKLHEAFKKIPNVIKTPEAELPPFWLMYFRDWLLSLQDAFDRDWELGTITFSGWTRNASDNGVIAYKLLAQTGEKESYNTSIVRSVRLVSDEGIIRPETFYKYLMVWHSIDDLGYTFSQANIKPEPERSWYNMRSAMDSHPLRVEPPALPINFSIIPFNLNNLRETRDFIHTIKSVRAICEEFEEAGLPNYPSGIPFTFWEQYVWLGEHLLIAVAVVLSASFVVMSFMLCNCWAAILIVVVLLMITVEVYGFMGLAGIKLSAVPAVTLILSVGVGVEFTVHMCMAFLTAVGDRNQRMQKAIEHVFSPVVDGAMSTLLGVIMLAGSEFDFIVRYFFHLLAALIVIGTVNGLLFLPVLLSLVGPGPEVKDVSLPGTASSASSNRELLPSSACRQRTPPADSELCILESVERQEEGTSGSRERRTRTSRGHRKGNNRGNRRGKRSKTPPRITVDSDSSSSTVTRVTARATVTVELHTEQVPAVERIYQNFPGGTQVGPIHSEGEISSEGLRVTDL